MARKGRIGLALLIGALAFVPVTGNAAKHFITIEDFFYTPTKTLVQVNDSVIWTWGGSFSHSTTSNVGSGKTWNSGLKTTGRFGILITSADGPGPFPYHCSLHLTMKDTIFVSPPPACCPVNTGNIDCDPGQVVDIADLSSLIDNLFISFAPLCCEKAGNTDGIPGVDIGDLSRLIDNLFISFAPLAACE